MNVVLPGVYVLGKTKDKNGDFEVHYVGRDDEDVSRGLKQHMAEWYPQFFYKHFHTSREAFEKECDLYHKLNPPGNQAHPARNADTDWTCPRCGSSD